MYFSDKQSTTSKIITIDIKERIKEHNISNNNEMIREIYSFKKKVITNKTQNNNNNKKKANEYTLDQLSRIRFIQLSLIVLLVCALCGVSCRIVSIFCRTCRKQKYGL